MIITAHWSATSPERINDYHVEFGAKVTIPTTLNNKLKTINDAKEVDWNELKSLFNIYKNVDFNVATTYGTYDINHDPRDGSPDIEVGALSMGGEHVGTTGPWGQWPYTYAHSWMHAGIIGRICKLKNIDPLGSFNDSNMQHNPLFNVSTHAERAIQTPDGPSANLRPSYGYFIFSGDPDSRWDITVRDVSEASKLSSPATAFTLAIENSKWIRNAAHSVMENGITDFWELNQ